MRRPDWEVLDLGQMKWVDMKILQVRKNEISRVASTSFKTNEIAGNKNTSCKLKYNGPNGKYFCKTNVMVRYGNASSKEK